ncbi:hypothetical protein LTR85_011813 [Meristemomyces frigidus]|nr:hypothetical protein LTR85_011813 [Meristemomyces frigidus]
MIAQGVLIWYAYRMDIAVHGVGINMASGCPGTANDKSCYFDELLEYLQKADKKGRTKAYKPTTVGQNLKPDVISTAAELKARDWESAMEPSKLFPKDFAYSGTKSPGFSDVFGKVGDVIRSYQSLPGGPASDEIAAVKHALTLTHQGRMAEQAKGMIALINLDLKAYDLPWKDVETKTVVAPRGLDNWVAFDAEQTLAAHPDARPKLVTFIKGYSDKYETLKGPAKNHADAIKACQDLESRIRSSC